MRPPLSWSRRAAVARGATASSFTKCRSLCARWQSPRFLESLGSENAPARGIFRRFEEARPTPLNGGNSAAPRRACGTAARAEAMSPIYPCFGSCHFSSCCGFGAGRPSRRSELSAGHALALPPPQPSLAADGPVWLSPRKSFRRVLTFPCHRSLVHTAASEMPHPKQRCAMPTRWRSSARLGARSPCLRVRSNPKKRAAAR